jgi:uncharacterized protein (DUF983 family)
VSEHPYRAEPGWWGALTRGLRRACPRCGQGHLFAGYVRAREACECCDLAFEPLRADDAPAYFTIFIVGHIVVAGLLYMEKAMHPEEWVQMAVWLPVTAILTFGLLPFVKGAVMGAIYASHGGERRSPAE